MKVFVTGGTGHIGQALVTALLERGDQVVALSRSADKAKRRLPAETKIVQGDPCYQGAWQDSLRGCDALINLAGESFGTQKWDARFRQKIHDSRVDTTRFLVEGVERLSEGDRPKILLSASGLDYYGFAEIPNFDDDPVSEDETGGESFLAGMYWDWEQEAKGSEALGLRVACMRTGIVLGSEGTFQIIKKRFERHLGGPMGLGTQWMSWIHIRDVVKGYLHVLDNPISGAVNLVSPGNVRNVEFAKKLALAMNRKSWFPTRAFLLRAQYGQWAEYFLKGRRTVPNVLSAHHYQFDFPNLDKALQDLLTK